MTKTDWKQDAKFTRFLIEAEYVRVKNQTLKPCVSLGLILYMHEAYLRGRDDARRKQEGKEGTDEALSS